MITHFSASQFKLFKESKEKYLRKYLYNEDIMPHFVKQYADFGKKIHKQIETGEADWMFSDLDWVYDVQELKIEKELEGINLLGYIDAVNTKGKIVADYKTATKEWSQYKVDTDHQLTFYAVLCELNFGWIPKELVIYRIETIMKPGGLDLTGVVDEMRTTRSKKQVDAFKSEIKTVWGDIQELVKEEIESGEYLG
jgi:hypothetical protein